MKLAYGTYAMPTVPLEDAIPMLAGIGYDGIEICVVPRHGAAPEQMDAARRQKIKALLKQHHMGVPALFGFGHVLAENEQDHQDGLEKARQTLQLARDLDIGEIPVLALGIGGKTAQWDAIKHDLVRYLKDYAELAAKEKFILAGEAHCGAAVDRSERALWLINAVNSPWIKLHFDIVHMFLAGEKEADSVKALVPITGHTHITDAVKHADGTFELVLPGKGDLNIVEYVKAMYKAGWNDFITLEVSVRVWNKPEYDPYDAAVFCYKVMTDAFAEAGVPRT
jgi:hydroxypyruvate isomerase